MPVYRFTMCYNHSFILCSHSVPLYSYQCIPNSHLIMRTYNPIVLLFYLVGCTVHFVLLKRYLKAVFHSILFPVHILFITFHLYFFIRILFFHSSTFNFYAFHSYTFFISILIICILSIRVLFICIICFESIFSVVYFQQFVYFSFAFFYSCILFTLFIGILFYLYTFTFIVLVRCLHSCSLSHTFHTQFSFSSFSFILS